MSLTTATVAKGAGAISGIVGVPAAAIGIHKYATSLYEVEQKVFDENIKLEVKDANPSAGKLTIKALVSANTTVEKNKLPKDYFWSCEITVVPTPSNQPAAETNTLTTNLTSKLPVSNATSNLENKKLLIKACSKNRKEKATDKSVVGQLTVEVITKDDSAKSYAFKNHSELDSLVE